MPLAYDLARVALLSALRFVLVQTLAVENDTPGQVSAALHFVCPSQFSAGLITAE